MKSTAYFQTQFLYSYPVSVICEVTVKGLITEFYDNIDEHSYLPCDCGLVPDQPQLSNNVFSVVKERLLLTDLHRISSIGRLMRRRLRKLLRNWKRGHGHWMSRSLIPSENGLNARNTYLRSMS